MSAAAQGQAHPSGPAFENGEERTRGCRRQRTVSYVDLSRPGAEGAVLFCLADCVTNLSNLVNGDTFANQYITDLTHEMSVKYLSISGHRDPKQRYEEAVENHQWVSKTGERTRLYDQ
jgi:hypothetical protein